MSHPSWPGFDSPAERELLVARWREADPTSVERLREQIRSGRYSRDGLLQALRRVAQEPGVDDYGPIDRLILALLHPEAPPVAVLALQPEMVFYLSTPIAGLLELISQGTFTAGDRLLDLGAGLGNVVMLVGLLTEAKASGVERDPALCAHAVRAAAALNLSVDFTNADAREADFDSPTVFFLYTPFRGTVLGEVLLRIRQQAEKRKVRLCTLGPCTYDVAMEPWLEPIEPVPPPNEIVTFTSRS